jgi:S1-C subfamily serine protease
MPVEHIPQLMDLPDLIRRLDPHLVRVQGRRHRGATGIRWGTDGSIVTPLHAVEHAETVTVGLADGRTLEATVAGRDPGLDLALLRADPAALASGSDEVAPEPAMAELVWRDAADLRVGEPVLAVARPGQTVRAALGILGVVGASLRTSTGGTIDRYVEVDRHVPRGFSGGLAIDLRGSVVGLTMRGLVRGASLALPHSSVKRAIDQLAAHGHVPRGYIGVGVYPARLPNVLAQKVGQSTAVAVVGIEEGGPGQTAGLQLGDIILSVDGEPMSSPISLRGALLDRAGAEVTLSVLRAGEATEIRVQAGQRP